MVTRRKTWREELADALQVAALLATRLRRDLGATSQEAVDLEGAVERAVKALRRQKKGGTK